MKKAAKGCALLLALVVLQVYVHAELLGAKSASASTDVALPSSGRLTTRGNNPVTVNGNAARSGETIFSGQQIQTPDGVGATVQLPGLGRVDLAPNTNAMLTFKNGRVVVNVVSGCVILIAGKGVEGVVETPGGSSEHTDKSKGSSVDLCTGKIPGAVPVVGHGAAAGAGASATSATAGTAGAVSGGLFGLGVPSTIALVTAASAFAIGGTFASTQGQPPCVPRGANPSPGEPRGRPCP
jgi:hypothetical protein